MKKRFFFINILFLLFLVSCRAKPVEQQITTIIPQKEEIVLNIGDSEIIDYDILPSGISEEIKIDVVDPNIAIIENERVIAIGYGETKIILKSTSNSEIYADIDVKVIRRSFNIIYELDGGKFTEQVVTTYQENIGLDVLPNPTKEGYQFNGWYLEDSLLTSVNPTLNKDITLYAKWEYIPKTFSIDYNLDGGMFLEEVPSSFIENVGLEELPIPTKEGYKFIGWELENEFVTSIDKTINKNITLKAIWSYIPKEYRIEYDLDGGEFTEEVPNSYFEFEGLEELPIPTKEEYEFVGWELNGNIITSIDKTSKEDVTLIAIWQLKFDVNKANEVIKMINTLPYHTTYNDKEKIDYILEYYNGLTEDTKNLVTNIDILHSKINVIEEIENNKTEITYVLGDNNYVSREELFNNFFSDFYMFIVNNHGTDYLIENNINNIEDFVTLAADFNGAGVSNLYGIGNLAGRYLLSKDINGILENQPETTFFGYCYQNNLYQDLLPFFIRFFAYWRIDERYANLNNYGADIFAEGWAPTVDIAKFFYYDENTSYVKTERMLDCFLNTASVVYGDLPTVLTQGMILPNDLKLRGYIFEGWYDNPEFTGDKITTITNTNEKVILYAKWTEDLYQQEKDKAEIVDIYIYNLTTSKAVVNKKTVTYIRNMYEDLTQVGKELVTDYNTFLRYEEQFAEDFLEPVTVNFTIEIDELLSKEAIQNAFIADFNSTTNSNIQSLDELISKRYTYMKKIGQFFANNSMRSKWYYLLDLLEDENSALGLQIQLKRIKENGSGDLEYVTKALGYLLKGESALEDSEVKVDFSKEEVQSKLTSQFGTYSVTYEKEAYLYTFTIDGYECLGFFDLNGDQVFKITENMNSNLKIKFVKK